MLIMEILTIIPARGGSKGIPYKNLSILAGKPLLVYSIEHAFNTKSVNRIIVSTDNPDIMQVAKTAGAEVVHRPVKISADTSTSESALLHVLEYLKDKEDYEPQLVVFLQPTSPLREHFDIQNAVDTLIKEEADSLFSASPFHWFIWRDESGELKSFNYDFQNRQCRQECPQEYIENGSIYIFKPWVLRKFNNRMGGKTATYIMPFWKIFQVDEKDDLEICEFYMRKKILRAEGSNA